MARELRSSSLQKYGETQRKAKDTLDDTSPLLLSIEGLDIGQQEGSSPSLPRSAPIKVSVSWQNISSQNSSGSSPPLTATSSPNRPIPVTYSRKYEKEIWRMNDDVMDEDDDEDDVEVNDETHIKRSDSDSQYASEPHVVRSCTGSPVPPHGSLHSSLSQTHHESKGHQKWPSTGSQKRHNVSLNHLLNFSLPERPKIAEEVRRKRRTYLPSFNKEKFVCANFRFVVKPGIDYTDLYKTPDAIIPWADVEQVMVTTAKRLCCPICLARPRAARVTRCGHVYCWGCLLRYLFINDGNWKRCPICYEPICADDLRGVRFINVTDHRVGGVITLQLMRRRKGSMTIYPSALAGSYSGNHILPESDEIAGKYERMIISTPDRLLQSLLHDREDLDIALYDAKESLDGEDISFIESAISATNIAIERIMGESANPLAITDEKQKSPLNSGVNVQRQSAAGGKRITLDDTGGLLSDKGQLYDLDNYYYFYQAQDGQLVFLHSINVRMLLTEFKSHDCLPAIISGKITYYHETAQSEDLRKKHRYLSHLPLLCELAFVEVDLSETISQEVYATFTEELKQRNANRAASVPSKMAEHHISIADEDDYDSLVKYESFKQFLSEQLKQTIDPASIPTGSLAPLSPLPSKGKDESGTTATSSYAQAARGLSSVELPLLPSSSSTSPHDDSRATTGNFGKGGVVNPFDKHSISIRDLDQPHDSPNPHSTSKGKTVVFTSNSLLPSSGVLSSSRRNRTSK